MSSRSNPKIRVVFDWDKTLDFGNRKEGCMKRKCVDNIIGSLTKIRKMNPTTEFYVCTAGAKTDLMYNTLVNPIPKTLLPNENIFSVKDCWFNSGLDVTKMEENKKLWKLITEGKVSCVRKLVGEGPLFFVDDSPSVTKGMRIMFRETGLPVGNVIHVTRDMVKECKALVESNSEKVFPHLTLLLQKINILSGSNLVEDLRPGATVASGTISSVEESGTPIRKCGTPFEPDVGEDDPSSPCPSYRPPSPRRSWSKGSLIKQALSPLHLYLPFNFSRVAEKVLRKKR